MSTRLYRRGFRSASVHPFWTTNLSLGRPSNTCIGNGQPFRRKNVFFFFFSLNFPISSLIKFARRAVAFLHCNRTVTDVVLTPYEYWGEQDYDGFYLYVKLYLHVYYLIAHLFFFTILLTVHGFNWARTLPYNNWWKKQPQMKTQKSSFELSKKIDMAVIASDNWRWKLCPVFFLLKGNIFFQL